MKFHAPHHADLHLRARGVRPQLLVAFAALMFGLSLSCQVWWFRNADGSCSSMLCHTKVLQSLRIIRENKMVALRAEDPEGCVGLTSGHLEGDFVKDDACWKRREVQRMLVDLVSNFSAIMNAHNVSYWVDSGTLLGAVRHRGLIPYDQDSDFGIDEDAYEYIRDNRIEVPAPYVLHVWNSSVNDPGHRDDGIPIRLINGDSGLYSDVFVFLRGKDRNGRPMMGPIPSGCFGGCVHCQCINRKKHFEIPSDWIYPVVPCKFAHLNVSCPREFKYLKFMFGDDYLRPQ